MDESGIWSILTDTLHYVKPEIDSSIIFSYDQKRHQNSKSKYFDAAVSNIPNENDNHSVDYTYNAKQENFDAANYNVPNVPVYSQALFPKYEEDRYGNLSLFTTSIFRPHESIRATYLWTEENTCSILESEAYDMEGNNIWFKQGKFPMPVIEEFEIPKVHDHIPKQGEANIYQTPLMDKHVFLPNPLLEPSSYPQVMSKQLPKYEGLLKPQPIEIKLRGRLPSYEVNKAIENYPFTMDIPSIEELKEKKRKLFHKIPEETVLGSIYQNS